MIFSPALEYLAYGSRSVLRKLSPLTKLSLLVIWLMLNIRLKGVSCAVFVLGAVTIFLIARPPLAAVRRPLAVALGIGAVLFVARLHFARIGPPADLPVAFYPAAFDTAVTSALRVVSGALLIVAYMATTSIGETLSALHRIRFPRTLIEVILIVYKYIFVFNDDGIRVRNAQMLRGGYGGFRRSLQSFGNLAGILLLRAANRSGAMVDALNVRGYRDSIFHPVEIAMPVPFEYLLIAISGIMPLAMSIGGGI